MDSEMCPCSAEMYDQCSTYHMCLAQTQETEPANSGHVDASYPESAYWYPDSEIYPSEYNNPTPAYDTTYADQQEQYVEPYVEQNASSDSEQRSIRIPWILVPALIGIILYIGLRGGHRSGHISPIFTREVQHWNQLIVDEAYAAEIDPDLAATVMQVESCGDPRATSRAGAAGLMQVMPFHFRFGEDRYHPSTNARAGLTFLGHLMKVTRGDARLAMAAYNGGESVLYKNESQWPAETRLYATFATIYFDAQSGKKESAALMEWYLTRGRSLCAQAADRLGLGK